MHFSARTLFYISICLLFASCNGYQKLLKSSDVNNKLTKANDYYTKKQWAKAQELYENVMPVMKNTRNYEPLFYRYAYTFYYMKDYLTASYRFKNFVEYFPNSPDAEECEYMEGLSLYKYSPKYQLDQTNTSKAMEVLQTFSNMHPKSKYTPDANAYIAECNYKLEEKQADAAKLYYNLGPYRPEYYRAAYVAYKSVMANFPESVNGDLYQLMIIRSMYYFARVSIKEKQEERFNNAIAAYHQLLDNYPKSKYLHDAEKIYTLADNNVKKIRNEHK
jgi:outer membrane protein assembly factor BamD